MLPTACFRDEFSDSVLTLTLSAATTSFDHVPDQRLGLVHVNLRPVCCCVIVASAMGQTLPKGQIRCLG